MIIQTLSAEQDVKPVNYGKQIIAVKGLVEIETVDPEGNRIVQDQGLALPSIKPVPPIGRAKDEVLLELGQTREKRREVNGRIGENSWDD